MISHVKWFLRPWQKRDASIVPTAPLWNETADSTASSTSRPAMNVCVVAEYYPRRRDPVLGVWAHEQALATRAAGANVRILRLG